MPPRKATRASVDADFEPRVFDPDDDRPGKNERFYRNVYAVVRMVPPGRVTTYGDVGTILGSPRIARQVGWALSALPGDTDVPWQRVINAHGMVSHRGDIARAALQEALLRAEGIPIGDRGKVDLAEVRFDYPGVKVPFRLDDARAVASVAKVTAPPPTTSVKSPDRTAPARPAPRTTRRAGPRG